MMDKLDDLCNQAVKKWGVFSQLDMVVEECAELIKAVQKYKRKPSDETKRNIHEECADVLLMINQIEFMDILRIKPTSVKELIDHEMRLKIARLEQRLSEDGDEPDE
jgi:hypothetical protein